MLWWVKPVLFTSLFAFVQLVKKVCQEKILSLSRFHGVVYFYVRLLILTSSKRRKRIEDEVFVLLSLTMKMLLIW